MPDVFRHVSCLLYCQKILLVFLFKKEYFQICALLALQVQITTQEKLFNTYGHEGHDDRGIFQLQHKSLGLIREGVRLTSHE